MTLRGNLLVGQGGGPTAVINASLLAIVEEARQHGEVQRILGAHFGLEGLLRGEVIDLGGIDPQQMRAVGRSPSAALGTCRLRLAPGDEERALDVLAARDVRFFLYIGGNDSADTAHRLQVAADRRCYELRCLGVPKTTDNDLAHMDHTPGYGSIARYVAMAAQDLAFDAAAIMTTDQVMLLEVMGRNAGWVAAASALARSRAGDAPHVILVPERPAPAADVVRRVCAAIQQHGHAVVVLAETVRDEHEQPWAQRTGDDGFGHARLSGAAERIADVLREKLGLKIRICRPGSLQRSAAWCVSSIDWQEAYLVGQVAVSNAVAGARDVMVTLLRQSSASYACTTGFVPLADVAHAERRLPPEFLNEDSEVTDAFLAYARPLIGEPLPAYARL